MQFDVDVDKMTEASHYVLNIVNGCDLHKLFKILYFADQDHLTQYGRPVFGDEYIAMPDGPVPSLLYDVLKYVRGDRPYVGIDRNWKEEFEFVSRHMVGSKRPARTDYLSATDIESLDKSILENRDMPFEDLRIKSHKEAWHNANSGRDGIIDVLDVAKEAGASFEMLKYINSNLEHRYCY